MIEEEFYAAVKLVSGEELFSLVSVSEEEERTFLLLDNPVIISPIIAKNGMPVGYKVEPWMTLPEDDIYIIDMKNVITMSEIFNQEIISVYKKFNSTSSEVSIDRRMGFLSKVDEARKTLEKSYRNS